jgi:hypothetical protein
MMAPPKGLEPLTDWLTASRSTWLSYGGTIWLRLSLQSQKDYLFFLYPSYPALTFILPI